MRYLTVCPAAQRDAANTVLSAPWFLAPYSDDAGATCTHYVVDSELRLEDNLGGVAGIETITYTARTENTLTLLQTAGYVPYLTEGGGA